jgi:hypothetical protein
MLPSVVPAAILLAAGVNNFIGGIKHRFNLVLVSTLILVIAFTFSGYTHTGWGKERFEFYNLATRVRDLANNEPVITIGVAPDIFVYYTRVGIRQINNNSEILEFFKTSMHNTIYAIINTKHIDSLPDVLNYTILHETTGHNVKSVALIKLERKT